MEQEVLQRRNAIFNLIYHRSINVYMSFVPKPVRWSLEILILCMALCTLCIWGYIHFRFIINSTDCLDQISERPFPYDVILQVEVYSNNSHIWLEREAALKELYKTINGETYNNDFEDEVKKGNLVNDNDWITKYCAESILVNATGTQYFCGVLLRSFQYNFINNGQETDVPDVDDQDGALISEPSISQHPMLDLNNNVSTDDSKENLYSHEIDEKWRLSNDAAFFAENRTLYELLDFYSLKLLAFDYTILEFSQEPGYLSLTHSSRAKLNISVVKIYIDPKNVTCFGGKFGQFLTQYILGYEMMVIASFKNLLPPGHGSGYVKDLLTGSQYYYRVQWMGKWRYGAGMLPALFFTLVASVLLRQVHYHIFKFLTHFQHLLNQGVPMPIQTGAQIPFLIVTYAAIGLIIVMSEALSDDSVFSLLMVATVWEVDQYYAIFCRQETSKMYLPWFFFLYHFLPYAYYIRFNGQFWFIPYVFHWLMLQHIMLFFLHHCELPSLQAVRRQQQYIPAQHEQHVPAPEQHVPAPEQHIPAQQEQHSHIPAQEQHIPAQREQHIPAQDQQHTPSQERQHTPIQEQLYNQIQPDHDSLDSDKSSIGIEPNESAHGFVPTQSQNPLNDKIPSPFPSELEEMRRRRLARFSN